MVAVNANLATLLKSKNYSMTQVRQVIFDVFTNANPLSMAEIVVALPFVNRASVYRTIAIFEELGILNRLTTGWKYKLELSDLFSEHHHHATCEACGKAVVFHESLVMEQAIQDAAQSVGFATSSHSLEIRGRCPDCQAALSYSYDQ